MIDKFKCFLMYEFKYWPRNIKCGIKNLISWFLIIWKDRQWDHTYIYIVLRHKLNLTEQMIRRDGIHINNKKDADKIKKCVLLLDRLLEDEYHENVYKNYYKKWGHPEMNFSDMEDKPGYSKLDIIYPNVETKKDEKLQSKQFRSLSLKEQELKDQDLKILFETMRKHIQTWWD